MSLPKEKLNGQTKLKLFTGGKAGTGRQNLFQISGTVTEALDRHMEPPYSFTQSQPAASQDISVLGKTVGSDGNLWVALPDRTNVDVTPTVTGSHTDWYNFTVTPTKYKLTINASSSTTNADLATNTPEFCVGQKVSLQATWSPALPTGTQKSHQWVISSDYINEIDLPATNEASTSYVLNPALLTNSACPVWWYSGNNKLVHCRVACQFANGQTATVYGQGNVSVDRPIISYFADTPPSYATNYVDGGTLYLQLGDNNNHGEMVYEVDVLSGYAGKIGIVQLIKRNASNGSIYSDSLGTGGQFWLDTQNPYKEYFLSVSANIELPYYFSDNPGVADVVSLLSGTTSCSDQFIDYVVFRPNIGNENDNIFVTLGVVSGGNPSWGWSASTYWSGTWGPPVGPPVTLPTWPDNSDNFPSWLHTYQNSQ